MYFKDQEFTRERFTELLSKLSDEGKSNAYFNNLIKVAKHIDKYLSIQNKTPTLLADYKYFHEKKHEYEYLTQDELKKICEYRFLLPHYPKGLNDKYRAFYYTLALTGARINEVLSLQWSDVHTDYVVFRDTKNGEDRFVPITPFLYEQFSTIAHEEDVVFNMKRATAAENLRRRVELCGIKRRVWFHLFRHTFVTYLLKAGADISIVARIVGHKDLSSTMRYNQLNLDDLRNMMYAHPLLSEGLSLRTILESLTRVAKMLVNTNAYTMNVTENAGEIAVFIKKNTIISDDTPPDSGDSSGTGDSNNSGTL